MNNHLYGELLAKFEEWYAMTHPTYAAQLPKISVNCEAEWADSIRAHHAAAHSAWTGLLDAMQEATRRQG